MAETNNVACQTTGEVDPTSRGVWEPFGTHHPDDVVIPRVSRGTQEFVPIAYFVGKIVLDEYVDLSPWVGNVGVFPHDASSRCGNVLRPLDSAAGGDRRVKDQATKEEEEATGGECPVATTSSHVAAHVRVHAEANTEQGFPIDNVRAV